MDDDINTIWKEYYNMLIRFVQNRVQDKSIAEDILQEVFIRIYNKLDTLKDPEKIQSWVFQITRNAIIDYYRSHKPTEELPEEVNESEWSLDDHDKKEMSSCFMSLIQNLPENYRAALIMAEIYGFKQKEVAKKLGISLPNAKIKIQRGRTMIKDILMQGCNFEFDRQGRIAGYSEEKGKCKPC